MFTLVRHSMHTSDLARFRRAVEPVRVGVTAAWAIASAGGVVFADELTAWDGAEGFMYPLGDMSLTPDPVGRFLSFPPLNRELFIPAVGPILLAA